MIIQFKHFHDTLNDMVILIPSFKFSFPKCDQFPVTFIVKNKNLNNIT